MEKMKKLIRDKIPNIIKGYKLKKFSPNEYKKEIKKKLIEKSRKVYKSDNKLNLIEEIADVIEVLNSIIYTYKLDINEIDNVCIDKHNKKGGFEKGYYIEDDTFEYKK